MSCPRAQVNGFLLRVKQKRLEQCEPSLSEHCGHHLWGKAGGEKHFQRLANRKGEYFIVQSELYGLSHRDLCADLPDMAIGTQELGVHGELYLRCCKSQAIEQSGVPGVREGIVILRQNARDSVSIQTRREVR